MRGNGKSWRAPLIALWRATWGFRAAADKRWAEGDVFPDFTLRDTSGRSHALSSDGPTVLWLTNLCEDCRLRAPLLGEMVRAGLRVLAVSILAPDDPLPLEYGQSAPFPLLLDPQDIVARRLGLRHPPETCPLYNLYIVGPDRRVLFRHHLSAVEPERLRLEWKKLRREPRLEESSQ